MGKLAKCHINTLILIIKPVAITSMDVKLIINESSLKSVIIEILEITRVIIKIIIIEYSSRYRNCESMWKMCRWRMIVSC